MPARMARNKILQDGCYAHVFSKSIEKRRIFQDAQDFQTFRESLLAVKAEYLFRIHHYCFMNTHFHLAVSIPSLDRFSVGLQRLKWSYTQYYNRRYQRKGPLWHERFKSLLIENDRYLYACGLYIEQNPVKAGLVAQSDDWAYTSASFYQKGRKDELLDGYEVPSLPDEIDRSDDIVFTRGAGIGTKIFKIYLKEATADRKMPVPF
ncbi:MAG: transposase [Candidatus Omnitrophica bacterium]|nr:transposase [Candidatus Omnitrophota bacterium]